MPTMGRYAGSGISLWIPGAARRVVWDVATRCVSRWVFRFMATNLPTRSLRLRPDSAYLLSSTRLEGFLGCEALKKQKAEGLRRKLVGLEIHDRAIARHGCEVVDRSDGR